MKQKIKILFLCTGNSCRSQMAEGWGRHLKGDHYEFYSAGISAQGLNKRAVQVMSEIGIDISHHSSNTLDDFPDMDFDVVFTVCGHADEVCPIFPKTTKKIHLGFDDPPQLAREAKSEEEALGHYRRVRDEIRDFILLLEEHV